MKLHELAAPAGSRKIRKRIGRGIGSGMGKTGGRGGKGTTARSGARIKRFEGGQMPLHRRVPKRGFKNTMFARKLNEVNLGGIQAAIDAGTLDPAAKIDAAALVKAGIIRRAKDGIRLLGAGEIKAKVAFSVYGASKSAIAAVEKAGGTVEVLAPKPQASEQAARCLYRPGTRDVALGRWFLQQNNWQPTSTSRRSPKPKSLRSGFGSHWVRF